MTAFSTAHRDRCVASDVLCRSHPSPASRWARDTPPDPTFAAASSKATESEEPGRLPSTSAASSVSAYAGPTAELGLRLAPRKGTKSQATWHRSVMCPPRSRLPAPFHHPSTRLNGQAQGDSWASLRLAWNRKPGPDAARRILQPEQSTSTAIGPPDPRCVRSTWRIQLALDLEKLRKGLRPLPPPRSSAPGDTRHPRRRNPFGLLAMTLSGPAEVSRARGRPALAARLLAPPARKQVTELFPDSIRSDTSRHETTAAPEGIRDRAPRGRSRAAHLL